MADNDSVREDSIPMPKPIALTDNQTAQFRERTMLGDAVIRFRRNRLAMFGLLIVAVLLAVAVFADVISPYPYDQADFSVAYELPFVDPGHILGADSVGRDYLSRLIYGARTSMLVGLVVPAISFAIALPLGAISGYRGGWVDFFIQRLVDIMTAIPRLLIAIFLLSIIGSGVDHLIFVLGITAWVDPTRLTRAQFLTFREREFVTAARSIGASDLRIAVTHILPNALAPLLVAFTFAVPLAIFGEAALSFLGIGITDPTASWGQMIGANTGTSSLRVYYHLALFPTILVALTMLGFSFVGDGLQEALDPGHTR